MPYWKMGIEKSNIDVIIPYIDSNDPEWREGYFQATEKNEIGCRYRNWNNLQYLFRGLEKFMPWINRVFLVVQSESQVPKWLNRDKENLRIVCHSDYIPQKLLPTYNTNSIELFLHRISGVSEHFIVFNDDVFPMHALVESDFFVDGKARIYNKKVVVGGSSQFNKMLQSNVDILQERFPEHTGFEIDHSTHNILKSAMAEIIESELAGIMARLGISKERDEINPTIQLVKDYTILTDRAIAPCIVSKLVNLYDKRRKLYYPDAKVICYNDTVNVKSDFKRLHERVALILERKFPQKSKYEKTENEVYTVL